MDAERHRPGWKTLLAFGIIYFVWGSTYYAIWVGVREVPPFLLAAMRFLIAGLALYGWTRARGERGPSRGEWASVSLVAFLIFGLDYGLVFWAEQRVASGLTAVMLATIPVFMALGEIFILRTQMLTGGAFLAVISCLLGEYRNFHAAGVSRGAWIALVYLIVAGSIIAFTAYVLLLHHESPTKVGTYAYVNPVVAVVLGYFLGGEELGLRTILGTVFVLISVVVITTTKATKI